MHTDWQLHVYLNNQHIICYEHAIKQIHPKMLQCFFVFLQIIAENF